METLREDLLRGIEASMLAKPNVSKRVAARQVWFARLNVARLTTTTAT